MNGTPVTVRDLESIMLTSVTPRGLGFLRDLPTGTKRFVFKISFVFVRFGGNVGAGSTEFRNTQFGSMYSVKSSLSLKTL